MAAQKDSEYDTFGKKFLIKKKDVVLLSEAAEYFCGRCMQDISDRFWKQNYSETEYIENGWKAVLYTAPHDPAPEGRNILDYETALDKGLEKMAEECELKAM